MLAQQAAQAAAAGTELVARLSPKTAAKRSASPKPAPPPAKYSWRQAAEKLYHKVTKHEWVKLDGDWGRIVQWRGEPRPSFIHATHEIQRVEKTPR